MKHKQTCKIMTRHLKATSVRTFLALALLTLTSVEGLAQQEKEVSQKEMLEIYDKVKTPYKYGLVLVGATNKQLTDCPTIFRRDKKWYMCFIVFNGRGYETWLAKSDDLLHWQKLGRLLSFSKSSDWDCNQKGGYIALTDTKWGGNYKLHSYDGKYWMSYFGSNSKGYEKGSLAAGVAFTSGNPTLPHEWQRLDKPVLAPYDTNASWWDNSKIYKNSIIEDKKRLTGHRFVMFYNAKGNAERIGMAVSDDMIHWQRFGKDPVLDHHTGITGDAYLQRINGLWVMFYFGAKYHKNPKIAAWNTFACSRDLIHWTDWDGEELIKPSEDYDELYAHKSCVIKWKGTVYHFYCACDNHRHRGIALATSKDLGKSTVRFPEK
ncbi:MAG: glycosylase [Prevotella sp.]